MFVAHRADLDAFLSLPVSLVKELHHDAIGPLTVHFQRLGGIAEVCAVDNILQDLRGVDAEIKSRRLGYV